METSVFKYCFDNSYSIVQNLFENYSNENTIEISFNEIPDNVLLNGKFEDEYFGKILTSFAAFRFKIDNENVHNEFQILADREIDISKIQHPKGFIKYSNICPIDNKIDFEKVFTNILYVRKLSVSINAFNWRISKIIKITSAKKNHKKLIWNYTVEDVFKPKNYNQIYYKLEYYGYPKDIISSFIDVMDLIYPSKFRIFNKIWYSINKIIDIDSLEPSIRYFREDIDYDNCKYYKFKNQLSTIIEYNKNVYEIKDTIIRISSSTFEGLRVFKCDNHKILSVLYNSNPNVEINTFKFIKPLDSPPKCDYIVELSTATKATSKTTSTNISSNASLKTSSNANLSKATLKDSLINEASKAKKYIISTTNKYITFSMKNGYLYLKGTKAEIISKDSISNKFSLRHNGYSLLDITIKNNEEKLILFYLPFNHKPIIKNVNHDGIVRCKLINAEYQIVEYVKDESLIDNYQNGLDIAISNYIKNQKIEASKIEILKTKTVQYIYETYLNRLNEVNIIYVIDEYSVYNPAILKRLTDINSVFIVYQSSKTLIGSFIKKVSSSVDTKIPQLIDINAKIYNKPNIDISVINIIENIFTFSNFSINSINVMLIFNQLDDLFILSFKKLYKSIISDDCIIIFKNNIETYEKMSDILEIVESIEYNNDTIVVCKTL